MVTINNEIPQLFLHLIIFDDIKCVLFTKKKVQQNIILKAFFKLKSHLHCIANCKIIKLCGKKQP
jgi:hypothetical protein